MTAAAFCIGWALGAGFMWAHFKINGLIRSREEWARWKSK